MTPKFEHRLSLLKEDFYMVNETIKLLKRLEELDELDMPKEGIETLRLVRLMTKNILRDLDDLLPPIMHS